jgi:hypothetical protein
VVLLEGPPWCAHSDAEERVWARIVLCPFPIAAPKERMAFRIGSTDSECVAAKTVVDSLIVVGTSEY